MSRMSRTLERPPSATIFRASRLPDASVLYVGGLLHAARGAELRSEVQSLLCRGERTILVSLSAVSDVDAAGMGELVRAYNLAVAATGRLRITEATSRVRELLNRVGLLDILTAEV